MHFKVMLCVATMLPACQRCKAGKCGVSNIDMQAGWGHYMFSRIMEHLVSDMSGGRADTVSEGSRVAPPFPMALGMAAIRSPRAPV